MGCDTVLTYDDGSKLRFHLGIVDHDVSGDMQLLYEHNHMT